LQGRRRLQLASVASIALSSFAMNFEDTTRLSTNSRTTDSRGAAKSTEFIISLMPRHAACALIFSMIRKFSRFCILTLVPLLPISSSAAESALAIVNAGVQQSEDAPFVNEDFRFLPGDYVYVSFQITGFAVKGDEDKESRQMSLSYEVTATDAHNVPLARPAAGEIKNELAPEDKNWSPKRRASFLLPSFLAAGECHIHFAAKDLIAGSEAIKDMPFRVGGVKVEPAQSITVEHFRFLREEDAHEALEVPAYRPGDTVYTSFDMAGYAMGEENRYRLAYDVTVLRPDGKPFFEKSNAAELESSSFYPAAYVPANLNIITSPTSPRGQYVILLRVRDLIGKGTYEIKQGFSLE
jgi:hypothetical protein